MTLDDPTMTADGKFQPNIVNSGVFMLSAVMQVIFNLFLFFIIIELLLSPFIIYNRIIYC